MGAVFPGTPVDGSLLINNEYTILGQAAAAQSISEDNLSLLFWTVTAAQSLFDPVSNEHKVTWPEFNTTFAEWKGTPEYSTLQQLWQGIKSKPYSKHYRENDRELRNMLSSMQWRELIMSLGRGAAQAMRHVLLRLMATSTSLPCFDGQNLADTDHPGLVYDSATDTYTPVVQVNYAPATNFDDAGVKEMVMRMTSYYDTSGNHYGNKYAEHSNLPSTNDIRTQPATAPQFHVWAGSDVIQDVKVLHRTISTNTSEYAGRFSYDKLDELPAKMWFVLWLNNPTADMSRRRPFLCRQDGLQVYVAQNGEHLDNQRFRASELHAHADFGFAGFHWPSCYVGVKP